MYSGPWSDSSQEKIAQLCQVEKYQIRIFADEYEAWWREFLPTLNDRLASAQGAHRGSPTDFGVMEWWRVALYCIIRAVHPSICVETGVCAGVSTSTMLEALRKNGHGVLHSVDLPYQYGDCVPYSGFRSYLPDGHSPGWVVPHELSSNWTLHFGSGADVLQILAPLLDRIDLFVHDSAHTPANVAAEFQAIKCGMHINTIVCCDDVHILDNHPDGVSMLSQFANSNKMERRTVGKLGVFRRKQEC